MLRVLPYLFLLSSLETGSLTEPGLSGQPARSLPSTCLHPHTLELQACEPHPAFAWVLEVPPSPHACARSHVFSPFPVFYDTEPLTSTGQLFCRLSPTPRLSNVF